MEARSITVGVFLLVLALLVRHSRSEEFCPNGCHCHYDHDSGDFYVDCSGLGLSELPHFPDTNVQILDLSENMFTFIPPEVAQFSNLRYLDMSSNLISSLPPFSLEGLHSLKQLNLSKNNISNWANLYPNELLQKTPFLEELSLADNQFTSFSSNDIALVLVSASVRYLDLSNCKITKVSGKEVIQGLISLETLKLNGNPLHGISDIKSDTLKTLDLSNCRISTLQSTALSGLSSLAYVNFARNYKLSLSTHGNVTSTSLRRVNLSYCNLDSIELGGFPNLKTAILRGNMIRQLMGNSFVANPLLENIDLSSNSINFVHSDAFWQLSNLKTLDLSFNAIPRIDGRTFKENEMLTQINLSRNYIARLQRIVASSLAHLNMSWCEILSVDADALGAMPSLIDLDLSHNLLYDDPWNIASETLQTLDLSMCRITAIRNTTFSRLPALMRINLSGNRFTTPFRVDFFDSNTYLSEIWLGDNPWRCDCRDSGFLDFFLFLTEPPRRVNDHKQLRCTSPEDFYGATWEAACRSVWYPQDIMGTTERIWTYFMLAILAFFGFFCLYSSIKRFVDSRRKLAAERERQENVEEMREVARENQLRLRQEAQLNAPDARESRPPCYEDAILLPKFDAASFASLDELLLRGKRKKKRRHRQSTGDEGTDGDDETDRVELRQSSRSRSENVLSVRAVVYQEPTDALPAQNSPIYQRPTSNRVVTANVHASPTESRGSRAQPSNDAELHYHSTDILRMDRPATSSPTSSRSVTVSVHQPGPSTSTNQIQDFNSRSYENSPYAKRKVKPLQHINPNGSIEEITDFEGYESSPYAKRRLQHLASFKGDRDRERPPLPARPPPSQGQQLLQDSDDDDDDGDDGGAISIRVVDDYFKPEQSKPDLDDYAVVTEDDVRRNLLEREKQQQSSVATNAGSSGSSSIEIIPARNERQQ
ncbi:toll-like receptor 6 [Aedes albopictus]|uniref:LRRCT domain-containing protein n=1 Tax=Aedes albopictus TaxID=7160 RepID=A0ABM1XXT0_AEDAL